MPPDCLWPEDNTPNIARSGPPMPLFYLAATLGLLGFAAWRDISTRTIPDTVSIALALLGLTLRLTQGLTAVALSLAVAACLFLILLACHARSLIGGGDIKLLTALTLGLPPIESYQLVTATALAGGVLAILYLALSRALAGMRRPAMTAGRRRYVLLRIAAVELWRIRRRCALPYGVAIAIGGMLIVVSSQGG
jgi:prepilin peptidase CpaA